MFYHGFMVGIPSWVQSFGVCGKDVQTMPRVAPHRLTARAVASLRDGVFGDGGNLWLTVKGNTRA